MRTLFCLLRRPVVQQQYGRLEINFSLKKPKTPYKTLAVQECFYSAGPLSTETTEIHRVSIGVGGLFCLSTFDFFFNDTTIYYAPLKIQNLRLHLENMSVQCALEDSVSFEPLSGVTSIFFDDKSFQVSD